MADKKYEILGKRLNATRHYRGYTAKQVADKIGFSISAYRMYESALRAPGWGTLTEIADFLDVPIDFLLGRDDYLESLGVVVDVPLTNPQGNPTA